MRKLTLLRRQMPRPDELKERVASSSLPPDKITYVPVNQAFETQFAETGFAPLKDADPHLWYRGRVLEDVQAALTTDLPLEKRNAALAKASATLDEKSFVAVFLRLEQEWPKMGADDKSYASGPSRAG